MKKNMSKNDNKNVNKKCDEKKMKKNNDLIYSEIRKRFNNKFDVEILSNSTRHIQLFFIDHSIFEMKS